MMKLDVMIALAATRAIQPVVAVHPATKERPTLKRAGATQYVQSYCPPVVGKACAASALISAAACRPVTTRAHSEMAIRSVPTADTGRPHTIAIEPPLGSATDMDAALDVSWALEARAILRCVIGIGDFGSANLHSCCQHSAHAWCSPFHELRIANARPKQLQKLKLRSRAGWWCGPSWYSCLTSSEYVRVTSLCF